LNIVYRTFPLRPATTGSSNKIPLLHPCPHRGSRTKNLPKNNEGFPFFTWIYTWSCATGSAFLGVNLLITFKCLQMAVNLKSCAKPRLKAQNRAITFYFKPDRPPPQMKGRCRVAVCFPELWEPPCTTAAGFPELWKPSRTTAASFPELWEPSRSTAAGFQVLNR
jgi:hypothetical protein